MKLKKILVLVAVVAVYLFSSVLADEKVPAATEPDTVVIDNFVKKKTAVTFSHKKHAHEYKIKECNECHHKDEKGKEKGCVIKDCHDGKKELTYTQDHGKIKKGDKIDDYSAKTTFYHANCLEDCHKNDKDKKAPTKCNDCHPKEKK
ncbi:MAG: cytochrome c3 family protein [bacterium]